MTLDRNMREFTFDLSAVYQMARKLRDDNRLKFKALNALEACYQCICFDPASHSEAEIKTSVIEADAILKSVLTGCPDPDPAEMSQLSDIRIWIPRGTGRTVKLSVNVRGLIQKCWNL